VAPFAEEILCFAFTNAAGLDKLYVVLVAPLFFDVIIRTSRLCACGELREVAGRCHSNTRPMLKGLLLAVMLIHSFFFNQMGILNLSFLGPSSPEYGLLISLSDL
jgi:hypothetical protein